MTVEIQKKLEGLSKILSCHDVFNGTVVGSMDCPKCGQKKVTLFEGKLLNMAIDSCVTKIKAGTPTEIFRVIETQMRGVRVGSDVYRAFTEILEERPNVQDTPSPIREEEKKESPTPRRVVPYLPETDEKRVSAPAKTYTMKMDLSGLLMQAVDPKADLISFLFYRDKLEENCIRIQYKPADDLLQIFWQEGFHLRRDSREYLAKGKEADSLQKFLLRRFDSFTGEQKLAIQKAFEISRKEETRYYKESHDALGLEYQSIEGSGAPLISISFYKRSSGIECAIEYEVSSDFFNILRKEGFTLRDNSNIYIAEGNEARVFWRLFKPTGTFTPKQQQEVETYCNWTQEPVLQAEDFHGAQEMGLIEPVQKRVSYRVSHLTQGSAIKFISDEKDAPLRSFQLNRTKAGQIVAILKYDSDSPFLKKLATIAKAPMSANYYFMSSQEFPQFWEALQETQCLTPVQIQTIHQFIEGNGTQISRDWQMVSPPSQVLEGLDLVSRLRPLLRILPDLVPALNMSLEKAPST